MLYQYIACFHFAKAKEAVFFLCLFLAFHTANGQTEITVDSLQNAEHIASDSSISDLSSQLDPDKPKPHIYRMNYWVTGSFCAVASALDIYAIPSIIKSKKDLTDEEMNAVNPDVYNWFDKWALKLDGSQRPEYYKASDYTLPAIIVSAAALGIDKNIRKDWLRIFLMYYEMHSLTFSLYNFSFFGPAFQNKLRPFAYYANDYPLEQRRTGNQRNSQYSGHTATAAASTFFMVKVYSDYHPDLGRKKYLLYGLASIPPLVEGYLRVKALAHFPSDVMIGFTIGAVCGIVVPELHRFKDRNVRLGVVPTPVGPGLSLQWCLEGKNQRVRGVGF